MTQVKQIAEFGKKLMSIENMENVLELISSEAKSLLHSDRCSIFIVDKEDEILWTKLSDGIGRIVIALDSGIVGETYKLQKPLIVNSPYDDPRFLPHIDKKTGYETKNIITTPIYNSKREIIGILQLLNKSRFDFDEKDLEALSFFANYVSGSLELALMNSK